MSRLRFQRRRLFLWRLSPCVDERAGPYVLAGLLPEPQLGCQRNIGTDREFFQFGGFLSAYLYDGRIYGTEIARGLDIL